MSLTNSEPHRLLVAFMATYSPEHERPGSRGRGPSKERAAGYGPWLGGRLRRLPGVARRQPARVLIAAFVGSRRRADTCTVYKRGPPIEDAEQVQLSIRLGPGV